MLSVFFFFNDTATTEIYTLSLHDALPISKHPAPRRSRRFAPSSASFRSVVAICSRVTLVEILKGQHRDLARVESGFHLLGGVAPLRAREAYHLPPDRIPVSSVGRIAERTLEHMFADYQEEPDEQGALALVDRFVLVL